MNETQLLEINLVKEKTPEPIDISKPGRSKDSEVSFKLVSPEGIIQIPKIKQTKKRVSRRRGNTAILSSSPYKNELEEAEQKKNKNSKGKTLVKKNLAPSPKKKKISKASMILKNNDSSGSEVSDAECLYCGDFYSSSTEGWLACSMCHHWAHNSCAGFEDEDDKAVLVCELCK
ncbi:uncharacterized protein LOC126739781 [Anthonomus grandis grandis]|uniref:uncharacterized protein LOC126739781 n=1 Tax=Anthonomus grandis grandis TaxID=2921223 RepID=UPI002166639E|nr:uncharacterized protein LOC126739781 [Anthonomus grandis grandis]